ncbi:hypothetical protein RB653_005866 [Dictyostelium firmibasis]|uniref:Cyclin-like domain-containing protein n=1 Tax=Dictyostelium firmibasis TaxID=79012 RepID=A0AAN7U808_9MYCE
MSKACGNCGSESFTSSNEGSVVCTGCGTVKESANIVSEVQFGGDSSIVGTFVSATRKPSSYRSLGGRDSRAMSVENARRRLDEIGNSLRIRNHLIDSAQRTFELAMENNFTKGRQTRLVAAACLYVVCRRERTPHLLIDFSENLQVNIFVVAGTFLQLIKLLNIQLPIVDPSFFIQRFASSLEFGDQTKDVIGTANKLVARMKRDWMSIGRKPSGICGASLYIASKIHGFKRSMKEIVHVVKIGEQTLLTRLDEFRKTPAATLKFDEFSGMDLEDECDPPSFTRARLKEKKEEEKQLLLEEKKERKRLRSEKKRLKKEKELKLLEPNKNNDQIKDLIVKNDDEDVDKENKIVLKKDGNEDEDEEDEDEEDENEEDENEEEDGKKIKKRKRNSKKETAIEDNNKEDEIEKESNDIVKQSENVQNISDISNVDSIPSTLLENIDKFEKIQSDMKSLAEKVKSTINEKIIPTQNKDNESQEPATTQSPQENTSLPTQENTSLPTPITTSQQPITDVPINKTMESVVSYPVIPSTVDQSIFAPTDDLDNLSNDELDLYLEHDKETIRKKEEIWVELNKEWIEKNEERQREIEEDIKAGRPPRKRKAAVSKKSAENAQVAAEEELKKRTRNAKLVEKLGLFKPNFVTMGLFGGAGASNNQSAVNAMLSADGTSKNTSINPKETNKEDDDEDDYELNPPNQSGSLLSQNYNDYDEEDIKMENFQLEDLSPNKVNKVYQDLKKFGSFLYNHKMGVFLVSFSSGVAYLYHNITQSHKRKQVKLAKERVMTFFETTQQVSEREVDAIITKFIDENEILSKIQTPTLSLIRSEKDPSEKLKLTEQLRDSIFTKLFTVLYIIPMITVFNRLQINLIGKYCYLDQVLYRGQDHSMRLINKQTESYFINSKNNCYFFKDIIFSQFIGFIQDQVKITLKDWKIEEQSSFEGFLKSLINIRNNFEKKEIISSISSNKSLLKYLIPTEEEIDDLVQSHKTPENDSDIEYQNLKMLYNEIRNIFESQKFYDVLKDSINQTFLEFTKSLREDFESTELKKQIDSIVLPDLPIEMEIPKPLVTMHNVILLPKINKQIGNIIANKKSIVEKIGSTDLINQLNYSVLTNDLDFNKVQF